MPAQSPEQIHALIAAAFDAGDLDAYMELFEDAATLVVPPEGQRVTGKDAIRAAVEPVFALEPSARMDVVGKLEADGMAITHGRWTLVGSENGRQVEMSGRGTMVSRRWPDGAWRIVLEDAMTPE